MSLCNICPRPGRCCTGFNLNIPSMTGLEAQCLAVEKGLPFALLEGHKSTAGDNKWRWWCTNLTLDGRCGDYENRPQLCRDYQPGTDKLCALRTNAITERLHVQRVAA